MEEKDCWSQITQTATLPAQERTDNQRQEGLLSDGDVVILMPLWSGQRG